MWRSPTHIQVSGAAGEAPRTFTFTKRVIKIGTSYSADLRLQGAGFGTMHAVLRRARGHLLLTATAQSGGVLSNGASVIQVKLDHGDVIHLGDLALRIFIGDLPEGAAPASSTADSDDGRQDEPEAASRSSFRVTTTVPGAISCPRCRGALQEARWVTGTGYRDGRMFSYLRCDRCRVSVISGDTLRDRYPHAEARLVASPLLQTNEAAGQACPSCAAELAHVTLGAGEVWVAVEECAGCGAVVMDDGEGPLLDQLLSKA